MKFIGNIDLYLRLKFRIVDAQERTTFSRELDGICATNLAEMAVNIALRSATQCATELRLETLIVLQFCTTVVRIIISKWISCTFQ